MKLSKLFKTKGRPPEKFQVCQGFDARDIDEDICRATEIAIEAGHIGEAMRARDVALIIDCSFKNKEYTVKGRLVYVVSIDTIEEKPE